MYHKENRSEEIFSLSLVLPFVLQIIFPFLWARHVFILNPPLLVFHSTLLLNYGIFLAFRFKNYKYIANPFIFKPISNITICITSDFVSSKRRLFQIHFLKSLSFQDLHIWISLKRNILSVKQAWSFRTHTHKQRIHIW